MSEVIGSFRSSFPLENCCRCPNLVREISLPVPVTRGFFASIASWPQTVCVSFRSFKVNLVNKDVGIESILFSVGFFSTGRLFCH